jgi:ATP-dependent DNA helicase PIF1
MLLDDAEYVAAMQSMCATICSVDALRREFACMLVNCRPSNCQLLFDMFMPELCGCEDPQPDDADCALWAIDSYCNELGHSLTEFGYRLPELRMLINYPEDHADVFRHNRDLAFAKFSEEQRAAAARIQDAVAAGQGGIFYIQAAGGCGKSFWANGVTADLRAAGLQPTVVAASGLAATVLDGGRTAHTVFGIPLHVDEHAFCYADASRRNAIISSPVIFWDECSMVHVNTANSVNRSLQDWTGNEALFGGKVVVFMGDFQQLLPVVRGGSGDSVTLMAADWWPLVTVIEFTHNFRSDLPEYRAFLQQVGSGEISSVQVPAQCLSADLDVLCREVLGEAAERGRHIVCLTVEDAAYINHRVIDGLPGALHLAAAADVKINAKDPDLYSDEFLGSLHLPSLPPAVLELRVGARWWQACGQRAGMHHAIPSHPNFDSADQVHADAQFGSASWLGEWCRGAAAECARIQHHSAHAIRAGCSAAPNQFHRAT